jgi:hypothetical protein
MSNYAISDELASLPAEARREAMDFILFLRQRHGSRMRKHPVSKPISLKDETFLGIWADRSDMKDSAGWVREVRDNEWIKDGHRQ